MIGAPGRPVRAPWPLDGEIGGLGVMFGRPAKGAPLVAELPQELDQTAPTDYNYGSQSPLDERIQPFDDFSYGAGLKTQLLWSDKRYRLAKGVDCSVQRKTMLGPNILTATPVTVDATNGIQDFFEIGGALYMLNGRYAQKRSSDTVFSVTAGGHDFGSGKVALTAKKFYSPASASTLIFISMSGSEKAYYFDGTSYTQFATFTALDFQNVGRQFYRAHDTNLLSLVNDSADPTVEANWSNAKQHVIGTNDSPIVRLGVSALGVLLIFKTDGMYTVNSDGTDVQYYPYLKFNPDPRSDSAKFVGYYGNDAYVQFDGTLHRIKPDFTLEPIGPERIAGNDTECHGYVSAFLGQGNAVFAWAGIYNPDSGNSYLAKFGAYRQTAVSIGGTDIPEASPARIDAWHFSLSDAYPSKITTMWETAVGAPAGHTRAFMGFANGMYAYWNLSCTPDPSACSSYGFRAQGKMYPALWHGTFLAEPKMLRSAIVTSPNLDASHTVQINFKTDPSAASYTPQGTIFNVTPDLRADFPNDSAGNLVDFEVVLNGPGDNTSPQLAGWGLAHALRKTATRQMFGFQVLAVDGLLDRERRPIRPGAQEIRDKIEACVSAAGAVVTVLPDETSRQLTYRSYAQAMSWDDNTKQWRAALDVKAFEFRQNDIFGTIGGLSDFTVGQLQPFVVEQLGRPGGSNQNFAYGSIGRLGAYTVGDLGSFYLPTLNFV